MEFWLGFNNFTERLQLPVNPPEYKVKTGNNVRIVSLANSGELALLGKGRLAEIELSSFFPVQLAPYCEYQDIPEPYEAVTQILRWKDSGKPVQFVITETPVNLLCVIEDFEYGETGGTRDVEFTLGLKEYRFVQVTQVAGRPGTRETPAVVTVKQGESLFLISKRVYGTLSHWRTIYEANKDTIGPDPSLIYPGQQLVIP